MKSRYRYMCIGFVFIFFVYNGICAVAEKSSLWMPPADLLQGTQTGSHLRVPLYRNAVEDWYKLSSVPEYQKLLIDTLTKEKDLARDYYIFYSAFSNRWRVPQDLYLLLKKHYEPSLPVENFRMFRWMPVDETTPQELLEKETSEYGLLNDNEGRIKSYFLCANYFLFGNVNFPGECTFEYFTNDKSNTSVSPVVFKGILKMFNVPEDKLTSYVDRLSRLNRKHLEAKPLSNGKVIQTLAQICIPKTLVDKVAYDCWVQGIPYDERIVSWVRNMAQIKFGRSPRYDATQDILDSIRKIFLVAKEDDVQGSHPIYLDMLEGIKTGRYSVAKFLDSFMRTPVMIPNGNEYQARLLVAGASYLGNPFYECKMFVYDSLSQEQKDAYNEELRSIVADIVHNTPEVIEAAPPIDQSGSAMISMRTSAKAIDLPAPEKPSSVQYLSQL